MNILFTMKACAITDSNRQARKTGERSCVAGLECIPRFHRSKIQELVERPVSNPDPIEHCWHLARYERAYFLLPVFRYGPAFQHHLQARGQRWGLSAGSQSVRPADESVRIMRSAKHDHRVDPGCCHARDGYHNNGMAGIGQGMWKAAGDHCA